MIVVYKHDGSELRVNADAVVVREGVYLVVREAGLVDPATNQKQSKLVAAFGVGSVAGVELTDGPVPDREAENLLPFVLPDRGALVPAPQEA